MQPKVSIVILNWNGLRNTIKCLQSLGSIIYPNYEIILVDNGSSDGSSDFFMREYPEIQLVSNVHNLGYSGGNNIGIIHALRRGTNYVLLLNNDTLVDPNFLTELIMIAEKDSKISIVQSKILSFGGDIEHTFIDKYGATLTKKSYTGTEDLEKSSPFYPCGACMLIKENVLNEQFFDKKLFAYYEDVDTGWQLRLKGYKICNAPKSICYHEGSSSLKNNIPFKMYLIWRNRIRVLMKNYSAYNLFKRIPLAMMLEFSASLFYTYKTRDIRYVIMYIKAIFWNIINIYDTLHQRKIVQSARIINDNEIESYMFNHSFEIDSILSNLKIFH